MGKGSIACVAYDIEAVLLHPEQKGIREISAISELDLLVQVVAVSNFQDDRL